MPECQFHHNTKKIYTKLQLLVFFDYTSITMVQSYTGKYHEFVAVCIVTSAWYNWCAKHGETRELKDIPMGELDRLLGHFFVSVRRKDGLLYEPDTLSSFQRNIDRHLTKDLHKPYSIIRDTQFAPSREKLKASRKFLKGKGKGNKPHAAEAIDATEVEQLCKQGALGAEDPVTLQQTIWWLISTQMGTRGRDEHHKFRFGDFTIKETSYGTDFIEFSLERGTKTRTGETEKSTNADARVFKPKMWATPDKPERYPVHIFRQFVHRRPPEMCQDDSPFYLSVNHKRAPGSYWYKKLPLGIHKIDGIMKNLAKIGALTGKKTNHSARKTQVQTLCGAGVADSAVMQLTGHKSVQSLNHYKKPSLEQQKHMSHCLATIVHHHLLQSSSHLFQSLLRLFLQLLWSCHFVQS